MRYIEWFLDRMKIKWAHTNGERYIHYLREKGVKIGNDISFHGKLTTISIDITRPSLVTIGNNVSFNGYFSLFTHDWGSYVLRNYYKEFIPSSGRVVIGNNVVFGRDVTILKNVVIGDNCIIGNGSIVTKSIPSNSVALGVPARVVSTLDEYFEKRKNESIQEALEYARSIKERFKREPKIEDFKEEFPLFLNGKDECPSLSIKKKLGPAYEYYITNHIAIFNGFQDFLKMVDMKISNTEK
jgi:acetyltransferase-like isoleucine patch superfamily enzyme